MQLIVFCKMPCYYKNQINEYNKPIHFVSFSVFLKINFDSTHFHGRFNVWTIDFKRLFSVYYSHTFGICSVFSFCVYFWCNFMYKPGWELCVVRIGKVVVNVSNGFLSVFFLHRICLSYVGVCKMELLTRISITIISTTNNINDLKSRKN